VLGDVIQDHLAADRDLEIEPVKDLREPVARFADQSAPPPRAARRARRCPESPSRARLLAAGPVMTGLRPAAGPECRRAGTAGTRPGPWPAGPAGSRRPDPGRAARPPRSSAHGGWEARTGVPRGQRPGAAARNLPTSR